MADEALRRELFAAAPAVPSSFYGVVEYVFERGKVTTIRLVETLKPEGKPVTR
jgi:hypothetical protein